MSRTIGIIGSGIMGVQLTEFLLLNGFKVVLKTRFMESSADIIMKIKKHLEKKCNDDIVKQQLNLLSITDDFQSLVECSIIIESVKEDFEIKKDIFEKISNILPETTIIATNTSSLSIEKLSQHIHHPNRFVGCHFFNPVQKMKLVEVINSSKTDNLTELSIMKMCEDLGKTAVVIKDSPGFIVNRLLLPQINEAVRMVDNEIATIENIDTATALGLNHPMGPLALADYIGIDTCVAILNSLYEETKNENYLPSRGLIDRMNNGHLGRKTKIGFYTYS